MPETDAKTSLDLGQVGSTGLRHYGGRIYEEEHRALRGSLGARIYREMADNDPVIGATLYTIESLCRQVEWTTEPAVEDDEAALAEKEFVDGCMRDMSHTWEELVAEVLSELTYGWSYFEVVHKIRRGPGESDGRYRSRFDDGRIGWRKIAIRAQESLEHWEIEDDGGIRGLHQRPLGGTGGGATVFLPIERCLLFRPKAPRNSPEGRSLLRTAYRPWKFGKRLEELEAIGIERDLAGFPVFEVPWTWLDTSKRTAAQAAIVNSLHDLVQQIRRDEREGAVIPAEMENVSGKQVASGFKFRLMNSGGQRTILPDTAIRRHQSRMAMTLLAQWLLLGQDKHGSFALADSNTNLFAVALGAILDSIAAVFNDYAIPRLMTANGVDESLWPRLTHGDVEDVDLKAISEAINNLVQAGVLVPDARLERRLREMAGLPEPEEEEDRGMDPGDTEDGGD